MKKDKINMLAGLENLNHYVLVLPESQIEELKKLCISAEWIVRQPTKKEMSELINRVPVIIDKPLKQLLDEIENKIRLTKTEA